MEADLNALMRWMEPQLEQCELVFCCVPAERLADAGGYAICSFREQEGVTLIARREDAVNCVSAYHHDHLFVPVREAERARDLG
jgi:hypothetical protein